MRLDPEGRERQVVAELLGPSAGDLLEIGCGDGRLTGEMVDMADTVTALDPEFPEVMKASLDLPGQARFLAGSGEQLPLAGSCVDTAVFSFSLHHQDPVTALAEARRTLRLDGRILVLEPVDHSLMTRLFAVVHDESAEYHRVEAAIAGSGLKTLRAGSFRALWVFEDFAEMTGYLFDYFGLETDRDREKEMAGLLGERRFDRPLAIEDTTRFWLLGEAPAEKNPVPSVNPV